MLQDNSYGRLRGCYAAWTCGAPHVLFADEPGELPALARERSLQ